MAAITARTLRRLSNFKLQSNEPVAHMRQALYFFIFDEMRLHFIDFLQCAAAHARMGARLPIEQCFSAGACPSEKQT